MKTKREDRLQGGGSDGGGKSGVQLDVIYWLVMGQFTRTAKAVRTGCS